MPVHCYALPCHCKLHPLLSTLVAVLDTKIPQNTHGTTLILWIHTVLECELSIKLCLIKSRAVLGK